MSGYDNVWCSFRILRGELGGARGSRLPRLSCTVISGLQTAGGAAPQRTHDVKQEDSSDGEDDFHSTMWVVSIWISGAPALRARDKRPSIYVGDVNLDFGGSGPPYG